MVNTLWKILVGVCLSHRSRLYVEFWSSENVSVDVVFGPLLCLNMLILSMSSGKLIKSQSVSQSVCSWVNPLLCFRGEFIAHIITHSFLVSGKPKSLLGTLRGLT